MDMPQNFNQKRGNAESGNEAHEERISKDDTGKQKCESHGTARREKQVGDCSQLSNGATEKRNKETREGNPKVIQGKRSRNTRKRRNISVSDSDITSPVKKKPSIDQHQCHVRSPSDAAVQYIKDRCSLPFPGASRGFYAKQNKKAISNAKRTRQREQLPVTRDEIKLVGMQRNRVDGSLEQNISIINKELMCCKNRTRKAELQAVVGVGEELQKSILLETSKAAKIYSKRKASLLNEKEATYFCPVDTYEKLSKHLNIVQIYIDQKAFIVEGKDTDINRVVEIVSDTLTKVKNSAVKGAVHSNLKDTFNDILNYLDSKRDRDVLEAIIAKITSVKNVVSLKGTQFKGSVSGHRANLNAKLRQFKNIEQNCQTVRNDMTVSQQHVHVQRTTKKRKEENIRTIAEGRGRKLKCEEFPELASYIEFAFGEGDRILRGGGGLQADRRLLDTKLFKAADNATVMRHVLEMLNNIKPEFSISTSCLYTYTNNCRKGTIQAKRHHHGREVNANVSLHKAPNTSEKVHPLNAHWTSSHVNYLVDSAAEDSNTFFLDSKDAKCIICGDIQPVLKPGKTWRNFETPDHTFDQSRVNAVTPMSHLFMDIRKQPELDNASLLIPNTDVTINVTRTGKAVTLINLSLTEPETVFRVFNELFLLMCIPSLDKFFCNQETGKLKEIMGFIVDNGPSEAPSNLLVQMLLVRLLNFLDLDKITQRSFAEYLSKRNFVECVHTVENKVLSDHGPFSCHWVHERASPGSKEHSKNMEYMANEVINCISKGIFNKQPIECFRGIGSNKNFIFGDEDGLKLFSLSYPKNEERKMKQCTNLRRVKF